MRLTFPLCRGLCSWSSRSSSSLSSDVLGDQIGQPGQFGRAHKALHKATGEQRAVKVVSKTKFTRTADKKVHFKELRLEIDILRQMQHENVIKLHDVFETINELFIVMEVCTGGELFDRIKAQPAGSYSEKDAQQVLRQICTGLSYLHKHKIAHCVSRGSMADLREHVCESCAGR